MSDNITIERIYLKNTTTRYAFWSAWVVRRSSFGCLVKNYGPISLRSTGFNHAKGGTAKLSNEDSGVVSAAQQAAKMKVAKGNYEVAQENTVMESVTTDEEFTDALATFFPLAIADKIYAAFRDNGYLPPSGDCDRPDIVDPPPEVSFSEGPVPAMWGTW